MRDYREATNGRVTREKAVLIVGTSEIKNAHRVTENDQDRAYSRSLLICISLNVRTTRGLRW